MKNFLLLLVAPSLFATYQSVVISGGNGGLVPTRPSTSKYTANAQMRVEFRISNCTSGSLASIFAGDIAFAIRTSDCHSMNFLDDNSVSSTVQFPSGATDVLVKAQRINGGESLCIEAWDAQNTNHYAVTCEYPESSPVPQDYSSANLWIGEEYQNTLNANLAYLRWFSTTTALGIPPDPNATGDMGEWEFEGNGNDSSGNGLNVTLGSSSYTPTLTYAPSVSFPNASNCFLNNSLSYLQGFCTFASSSITLTSGAYTPNQGDTLSYTWTQASGPVSGAISGSTTETPTISGLSQFGEYDFQLTATDSEANSGAATLSVGIVTVGGPQNCIVSDVPTNLQYLVGPLTPWGSSCDPWPWYDIAEVANANVLQSTFTVPTETSESGTVVVNTATSPPTLQGTGTSFTTLPHSYDGNGCDLGVFILLHWNAEGGNGTGRALMQLSNGSGAACDGTPHYLVTNDTSWQITSLQTSQLPPGLGSTGYSFTSVNINDLYVPYSVAQNGVGGNYSWNYYDNVIAFYRLYFRTGITAYLTYARRLADAWWSYALDHGYSAAPAFPRLLGLPGMMARAIDGHSERWPGIENKTGGGPQGTPNPPGNLDFRETGYSESYVSLLTALDPNITGNPTTQATYCGYVASSITGFWAPVLSFGYKTLSYSVNNGYPTYGYEIEPWQLPITASGLRDAYRALSSSNCNDPTDAATALSYTIQTANYAYQTGAVGFRNIPASNGGGQGRPSLAYITGTPSSLVFSG